MLFNVLKFFVQFSQFLPHLFLFFFVLNSFFLQLCQTFLIANLLLTFSIFLTLLLLDLLLFFVGELVELQEWLLLELRLFFTFGLEVFSMFRQLMLLHDHLVLERFEQNVEVAIHVDAPFF